VSLGVEVWVLGQGGAPDRVVPDLGDYAVTPIASDIGSVSLNYPRDGRRFDLLHAVRTQDRPVEVEIRTAGSTTGAIGALLFTASGDRIKPSDVWTFTGYTLECVMRRARLPYNADPAQGGTDKGESSFSANAGVIMRTLVQRAQARGTLTNVSTASFSNTLDSNGVPWARTAVVTLAPGRDYADILATTLHAAELCEWEVRRAPGGGYELRLYNPGTRGVDRTTPGPTQLTLEHGRDLEDAPVRHDVEPIRTRLTVAGKDGLVTTASNPTAEARLGYRVEGYESFGDVADPGTLAAVAQLAASTAGDGESEHTHGLILEEGHPLPGRDFGLSDWVLCAVDGVAVRRRVVAYDLSREGRDVRAAATFGDLIAARAVRVQRAIDALTNGSTVVGAPAPPPDVDDGKAPAAPAGLTGTSRAYFDSAGVPLAQVTATWLAVTTNADGTAIGDLSGYEVQFRYLPGQAGNLSPDWQTAGITSATTLRWSPMVQGRAIELRVLAYDRYNRDSAWSPTFAMTTATDAEAPPVASAPTPYSHLGLLVVPWDGKGVGGVAMPGDFEVCEIHVSTTPNFTPSRPLDGNERLDLGASTTYAGELRAAGEWPIDIGAAGYGTTFYVRLVTRDRTGNAAGPSAQASAVLEQVKDGDLAGMSIGKLTVGIMSAIMTISGIIRTAAAGARVELDTAGLRCIAADGRVLFEFSIPNNLLSLAGRLLAGAGIGVGRTIDVNPTTPAIDMYPDGTTARIRQRADVSAFPTGGNGPVYTRERLNTAGQTDGPTLIEWLGGSLRTFRRTNGQLFGGKLQLQPDAAFFGVTDPATGVDATIQVRSDGDTLILTDGGELFIDTDGGLIRFTEPLGTGGAGFSFKVQGLGDNGYRTVFSQDKNVIRFVDNSSNQFVGDGNGGLKSFVIPHPTDDSRWLVHVATESPEALVEYHGEAELHGGTAVVNLPAYFEGLAADEGRRVQATMLLPDEPLVELVDSPPPPAGMPGAQRPPLLIPECQQVRPVAASVPRGGRFRLACPAPDGTRVAWRVVAPRRGSSFPVEPHRDDVDVHGDGPYRYLTPRRPAA
jgi:hypothetical protein